MRPIDVASCITLNFMFDFEKLIVYHKAKIFHTAVVSYLNTTKVKKITRDQLQRASMSIVLNIAEASGRFTKPDRRNFLVIARGSIFECVAILDILHSEKAIDPELYNHLYKSCEELSKIMLAMIKNLQPGG